MVGTGTVMLEASGPGEVTAGMIDCGHDVEIMDQDLVICTLGRKKEI